MNLIAEIQICFVIILIETALLACAIICIFSDRAEKKNAKEKHDNSL